MTADIHAWAIRHSVSMVALNDLYELLGVGSRPVGVEQPSESEAAVQNRVLLEAPHAGVMLFRNNVGVLQDKNGRPVRYGLANDSKAVNERFKSGDLIGWRRKLITANMVGGHIAQFVSREVKEAGWRYTGTPREVAQLAWANLVLVAGGDACFVTGTGTL